MSDPSVQAGESRVALIVTRGDYPNFYEATSLATAYGALGNDVHMLLAWGALSKYARGDLNQFEVSLNEGLDGKTIEHLKGEMADGKLPDQAMLLEELRNMGLVRLYACSGSTAYMGYTTEQMEEMVDEVIGITAFVNDMELAKRIFFM